MRIKIGLLLDSMVIPQWQQHIINQIKNNPSFSLQWVVVNATPTSSSGNLFYRIFRKLDRAVFPSKQDCFHRVNVETLLHGVTTSSVQPIQKKFTDEFPAAAVEAVKQQELDVIIRFGFRILKGDILQAAKHGVWSLHHGDNAVNRGGPPAFWEVVNNEPVTGVTLQVLSDDLDGGQVIDKAFSCTDRTSFNRNQNALYWAGVELFCNALKRLSDHRYPFPSPFGEGPGVRYYSNPLYRNPTNTEALSIFLTFWLRRLLEAGRSLFKKPQWSVYYAFRKGSSGETSLYRYKKLTPPAGTDWADPFVVKQDDRYVIFFEELHRSDRSKRSDRLAKAHISCLEFNSEGKLLSEKPLKVLQEPFHLSYPFIFEHEGSRWMLPEAAESKEVWLYHCEQFPQQWKKHTMLLKEALYDPTLIFHEGLWYLFGTQKPFAGNSPHQYLYIYYSDDVWNGEWQAHPKNPVTRDVRGARPAGKIFRRHDKLIRPSQLGAPVYGYGIRFQEITKLTPTEYEEQFLEDILPLWKRGLRATHTFNTVDGFSLVDAQE